MVVGLLIGAATPVVGHSPGAAGEFDAVGQLPVVPLQGFVPVVTEHRYRMSAKIRPLLLFWIGKDNVGGARMRWRRGEDGAVGYDLLIGSDPARAPRQVNRWGFILEETKGGETAILGIMKKSDEDSLDEAKSHVSNEAKGGVVFKMIQSRNTATESVATVTMTQVTRDYSYRELDALYDALVKSPGPPRHKTTAVPAGGRPGFLIGLAELLHDAVESYKRDRRAPGRKSVPYAYYGKQYDLTRASSEVLTSATFGARTYPRLLQSEFELRDRKASWKEAFTIACGIEGALTEVPVYVGYQPRWWFRADMVLDDREVF